WLPTFTITGQYGTQSTEFSKWFASGTNIWQAFAGVSIPLFSQGRPGAGEQVNIARARAAQARSRYEQTVLVALREVEDALVGLRTAQDRTAAQERQVIALRRALELDGQRAGLLLSGNGRSSGSPSRSGRESAGLVAREARRTPFPGRREGAAAAVRLGGASALRAV